MFSVVLVSLRLREAVSAWASMKGGGELFHCSCSFSLWQPHSGLRVCMVLKSFLLFLQQWGTSVSVSMGSLATDCSLPLPHRERDFFFYPSFSCNGSLPMPWGPWALLLFPNGLRLDFTGGLETV